MNNIEKAYKVECRVCKQIYANWSGSTPCCGSLADLLDDNLESTGEAVLFSNFGEVKIKIPK